MYVCTGLELSADVQITMVVLLLLEAQMNEGQMSLSGSKTLTYKGKQIHTYTLIHMDHLDGLLIYY